MNKPNHCKYDGPNCGECGTLTTLIYTVEVSKGVERGLIRYKCWECDDAWPYHEEDVRNLPSERRKRILSES